MSLAEWVQEYGYWAVLIGTFLEGETIVIVAGFAAQRGHLDVSLVILLSFLGSFSGDQLVYFIGRKFGAPVIAKFPSMVPRVAKASALIDRYRTWIVLGFRFVYGVRNVTPFTVGMVGIPPKHFAPLNCLGAIIWAISFGMAGYFFGQAFEELFETAHIYEEAALAVIAVLVVLIFVISRARKRRAARRAEALRVSTPPGS